MEKKIKTLKDKILLLWAQLAPTYDPYPSVPPMPVWEIRVDQNTVRIVASSRITALIKAKRKYPGAKDIRVIRSVNIWEVAKEISQHK